MLWPQIVLQAILGLFACFGGSGKAKRGKNCHCFMYCDVTTDHNSQNENDSIEDPSPEQKSDE